MFQSKFTPYYLIIDLYSLFSKKNNKTFNIIDFF